MGLFDIFKPKTVEARYKTLLGLFRRTHRTFTITRNEKCIVEFTFGIDNDNKQYWSIEQYFDAPKIITGAYTYDFSKKVTITVSTSVDGTPVKVQKTFDQSTSQTVMYNTVIQASIEELAKAIDNPTKRREENIGKKETPNTSSKNEDSDNSSVSDNVKATTKKEAEVNYIKDTEKIIKDALTVEQKQALLGLALRLCDDYCISDYRNQVNEIIQNYKTSLGLNNMQLTYTSYKIAWTDIDNYIELVKPLKKRGEYIQFINVCKKLYILGEDNIFIDHNFAYIFRGLGYTSKEILEMEKQQA